MTGYVLFMIDKSPEQYHEYKLDRKDPKNYEEAENARLTLEDLHSSDQPGHNDESKEYTATENYRAGGERLLHHHLSKHIRLSSGSGQNVFPG
ncbi:unnamed protein product [Didymodactylos carnosus]|uniref:Uncharacterized protein n=1 Tax=Didymodactylos carnosus TaxID=1234261 RepID=A0A814S1G7_9BILA|nr:unnamed protein product [Didymodactylos carnosus]CAF1139220.1 unnamed protein product [Didymodactylos carnosus]CAF3731461.1 unnamed protein product [Didymodactylos carnosus]CAF3902928.1 unnamed protein product [Didymodactylos carnosus]